MSIRIIETENIVDSPNESDMRLRRIRCLNQRFNNLSGGSKNKNKLFKKIYKKRIKKIYKKSIKKSVKKKNKKRNKNKKKNNN